MTSLNLNIDKSLNFPIICTSNGVYSNSLGVDMLLTAQRLYNNECNNKYSVFSGELINGFPILNVAIYRAKEDATTLEQAQMNLLIRNFSKKE